jgi:hypothetical protein
LFKGGASRRRRPGGWPSAPPNAPTGLRPSGAGGRGQAGGQRNRRPTRSKRGEDGAPERQEAAAQLDADRLAIPSAAQLDAGPLDPPAHSFRRRGYTMFCVACFPFARVPGRQVPPPHAGRPSGNCVAPPAGAVKQFPIRYAALHVPLEFLDSSGRLRNCRLLGFGGADSGGLPARQPQDQAHGRGHDYLLRCHRAASLGGRRASRRRPEPAQSRDIPCGSGTDGNGQDGATSPPRQHDLPGPGTTENRGVPGSSPGLAIFGRPCIWASYWRRSEVRGGPFQGRI